MPIKRKNNAADMMQRTKETYVDPLPFATAETVPTQEPSIAPAQKGRGGRNKSRTIEHKDGITLYLEPAHLEAMKTIPGFGKQDIARTAIELFLEQYYDKQLGMISTQGLLAIKKYVEKTSL